MDEDVPVEQVEQAVAKVKKKIKVMTKENKDLLIRDLCGRLPYGCLCEIRQREGCSPVLIDNLNCGTIKGVLDYNWYVHPYLRPMASMTEEEKHDYLYLCEKRLDREVKDSVTYYYFDTIESFDYLNKHHFDYRDLIDKGLAIEVTDDNNPYND